MNLIHRRDFLRHSAVFGAGLSMISCSSYPTSSFNKNSRLRVLGIGVEGTIGGHDLEQIASHPKVDIVGLCDVDAPSLERAKAKYAKTVQFAVKDYREAFAKHGDQFDAVLVSTPDHSHCSIMSAALAAGKHLYGQKPVVQQLEELDIMGRALKVRSDLVTQTGAQRIESPARRAAVEILRQGLLGKVKSAHISFGGNAVSGGHYFADGKLGAPIAPPAGFDYDLWLCGAQFEECRPQMVQRQWRSWWNYGGGMVGDWIVHLSDVLFFAFPELQSPVRVRTEADPKAGVFHSGKIHSVVEYAVSGKHFAGEVFPLHMRDNGEFPDPASIGLKTKPGANTTVIVCEGGTLVLGASGPIEVWRDGVMTPGLKMPGLPAFAKFNHWHAWVDKIYGVPDCNHWTPLEIGLCCTEPGILAVKAARFPGETLAWDRASLSFTGHDEANRLLVRREYRKDFAPARL
ncbi:MAG: Inositol 2-dehydrogenase [Verrucomicrobiota bacterium]|jgi:predicted dehydrogenase